MVDKIEGRTPEPDGDDDGPEWTDAMFARAKPAGEMLPPDAAALLLRPRGRPRITESMRKRQVTLRLAPDVIAALRATGPGWMARAEAMLRAGLALDEGK